MKHQQKRLKKKTVFIFRTAGDRNLQSTDPTVTSLTITVTGTHINVDR
ncbi:MULTISPECIES: hypothetical protein [unclassified Pedobacter]|nr:MULTISPECIES: hypothetical protein [unclassified Pedobacter]